MSVGYSGSRRSGGGWRGGLQAAHTPTLRRFYRGSPIGRCIPRRPLLQVTPPQPPSDCFAPLSRLSHAYSVPTSPPQDSTLDSSAHTHWSLCLDEYTFRNPSSEGYGVSGSGFRIRLFVERCLEILPETFCCALFFTAVFKPISFRHSHTHTNFSSLFSQILYYSHSY